MSTTTDQARNAGIYLALRENGLIKEAGIREALRFLLTGRATGYHGTSAGLAEKIRAGEGLIPKKSLGITKQIEKLTGADPAVGRRLTFLTRSKPEAARYARGQAFLEATEVPQALWPVQAMDRVIDRGAKEILPLGRERLRALRGQIQAKRKGVLEARYPAREFKALKNPEIDLVSARARQRLEELGFSGAVSRTASRVSGVLPFAKTYGLRSRGGAAMPSKYIRGSEAYERISLPEIIDHLKHVRAHPRETAHEALQQLSSYSFGLPRAWAKPGLRTEAARKQVNPILAPILQHRPNMV